MTDLCKAVVWIFTCPEARLLSDALLPHLHKGMVKRGNASHLKKAKEKNLSQLFLAAGIYLIRTGD